MLFYDCIWVFFNFYSTIDVYAEVLEQRNARIGLVYTYSASTRLIYIYYNTDVTQH